MNDASVLRLAQENNRAPMNICPSCNTPNPENVKFCLQCACSLATKCDTLCPACKHPVSDGARFCGQCGEKLPQERLCGGCGNVLSEGNRFCGQCGTPAGSADESTSAEASASKPIRLPPFAAGNGNAGQANSLLRPNVEQKSRISPREDELMDHLRSLMPHSLANKIDAAGAHISGEQREVTVLFLDVTNFTAASHRLDSEDVYLIVDEAMRLLVEIVYKYEGTVDKFTGDGLIALFGAPIAHENDPERALRTSLEMLQVLQPLRQRTLAQYSFDFQVRIGVNTGLVIAGSLGNNLHMEYTVIGDTVNMASRLETTAQPGSVLVSFSTYQRTRPLFNFVTLPPLMMKGFPDPVRAYRPIQVREQPGSVRGLPGMQVQMIGREQDLARLHNSMRIVGSESRRRISLITGDAGLGKSRLVMEFCASLRSQNIRYVQGNCLAYANARPMWVIAEMIREIVQITEIDPVEYQVEKLQEFIAAQSFDESIALPVLLHVLELPFSNEIDKITFEAQSDSARATINNFLRQILLHSQDMPFVLVFDDLHWVDSASRQFLIELIETSDTFPLHLILVSRDFERLTVVRPIIEACAACQDDFDDIRLRALSVAESRLLVNQLVWHSSPEIEELNDVIVARAEGNPFYTEEIVRMLMDKGGIIDQDNEWIITSRSREILRSVPGTLRGLILARFDQLAPDLRHTLQQAAVLGRSFPARLLEELHEDNMDALLEQLLALTDRQFLSEETNSTEREFSFRHTLIQEAVYSTLLKRDRRRLHGYVADVLRNTNFWLPEEQAQVLAYHYSESSNPDRANGYPGPKTESTPRRAFFDSNNIQPSPVSSVV